MDATTHQLEPGLRVRNVFRTMFVRGLGIISAAALAVVIAAPAAATGTPSPESTPTLLSDCTATLPLKTPCSPLITPPTAAGGSWTLTLPGVGSLVFTVDPITNQIVSASISGVDVAFTATAFTVGGDSNQVGATFTNVADPTQVYTINARVQPPTTAGGTPIVSATVTSPEKEEQDDAHDKDHENEQKSSDNKTEVGDQGGTAGGGD